MERFPVLFAGTPEIAAISLRALLEHGPIDVRAVLTNPDAPSGRGRQRRPSPVKALALEHGVPVLQPERLDAEARATVTAHDPQLLVVVAFGRIFGSKFLALFPRGGVNLHPSLLPLYRGPSPIQGALLA
jgi:methionyl-tRNA formyltransferase